MAILNFTKKLYALFAPGMAGANVFLLNHENISSSFVRPSEVALDMLSKVYLFRARDHLGGLVDIGPCRVVSVVVNCNADPEICLLPEGKENADFYDLSDLVFCLPYQPVVHH